MAKERNLRRKGPSGGGGGNDSGSSSGSSQISLTPGTMTLLNLELALVYLFSQAPSFSSSPLIELSGSCVPVSAFPTDHLCLCASDS